MRKIYQKKNSQLFCDFTKRPDVRHGKKWQENEASDCQKVMELFYDRISLYIWNIKKKFLRKEK